MNQQQNSIELVSVTFNAGESRLFALSGEYFEVIDAPNPIDVLLSDFNGAQRARMNQAAASFYSKGVAYGVIQITSASAQTIRFAYGTGETGTRRSTGSVTVSGAIALDAPTIAALNQIEQPSGFFASKSLLAANTAQQVFASGSNINGAIIWSAEAYTRGGNEQALIAKSGPAPLTVVDGNVLLTPLRSDYTTANNSSMALQRPIRIAAGQGLFFITTNAESADAMRSCRFSLI